MALIDLANGARPRRAAPWLLAVAAMLGGAHAQAQTLHDAFEAAWMRQPAQRAHTERAAELDARLRATQALTPEPGSLTLGQRSDQLGSKLGRRETEIEFGAPLWLPGQRTRQHAVVAGEQLVYAASQQVARWQLAGELREAWWQARLADAERALARQRSASAAALAGDVARRVKAGELARVDANRAQGELQSAQIGMGESESRALRARLQFTALSGVTDLPLADEVAASANDAVHPRRLLGAQQSALAQRRIEHAAATRRDAPELSLGVLRERASAADTYGNSVALRLKIPFASDARNQPRMAAALAERAEAEATRDNDSARIDADVASARADVTQAQAALLLATTRSELARDTLELLERSFRLGELDLPTRLRADAERFDAERMLLRARLDVGRAVSTFNQALGVLP